jgi:hypothetical protein
MSVYNQGLSTLDDDIGDLSTRVQDAQDEQDVVDSNVNTLYDNMTTDAGGQFGSFVTKSISTSKNSATWQNLWTMTLQPGNYLLNYNLLIQRQNDSTSDTLQYISLRVIENTATLSNASPPATRYYPNATAYNALTVVATMDGCVPICCTDGGTAYFEILIQTRDGGVNAWSISTIAGVGSSYSGTNLLSVMAQPLQLVWLGNMGEFS